jgi:uncharacterized protein YbjT (DUF2867 family)
VHVLVLGATGFIGRHVVGRLLAAGHQVTAAARDVDQVRRRFPAAIPVAVDLNHMTTPDSWRPLLAGADAVVNCAGILHERRGQSMDAIHRAAPVALFQACAASRIGRVIQISAVSADEAAGTSYARSKKAADDLLRSLDVDWVVLRPSLVYGRGSYGGTSFLRGLAGLPWMTPVIGAGGQQFTPIHVDDLATTILLALEGKLARQSLEPCGPATLTLAEIVALTRSWLGLPPARRLYVPMPLVRSLARLGDVLPLGPVNSTALRQLDYGNAADPAVFVAASGLEPRSMEAAFAADPALVQDRWHARLYFLRPLAALALALVWLVSGLVGWHAPADMVVAIAGRLGLSPIMGLTFALAACAVDVALALSLFLTPLRWTWVSAVAQGAVVLGYTLVLTITMPQLWSDPFGPLLKNLAVLVLIGAWAALRDDR